MVPSAGRERHLVEAVDCRPVLRAEGDMCASHRIPPSDPEVEPARVGVVRERVGFLVDDAIAEQREHLVVEAPRAVEVADVDGDVLDAHCGFWQTASMLFPSASRMKAP